MLFIGLSLVLKPFIFMVRCPSSAACELQPLMRLCGNSLYPQVSLRYRTVCSKLVSILKEEYNLMGCIHAMQVRALVTCEDLHAIQVRALVTCEDLHAIQVRALVTCEDLHAMQVRALVTCENLHAIQVRALVTCEDLHAIHVRALVSC